MSKVTTVVCYVLFRILLPVILLAAVLFRYNALSFLYAILLLLAPLFSSPDVRTITGSTGLYLKGVIGISVLTVITQAVFQFTLLGLDNNGTPAKELLPNCSWQEKLSRQFGVQSLDGTPAAHIVRLILPDVAVLIFSIVVFVVCKVLIAKSFRAEAELPSFETSTSRSVVKVQQQKKTCDVAIHVGEFFTLLFLALAAIAVPSVLSSFYFVSFIGLMTWWALYKSYGRCFAFYRVVILVYAALHILLLYLYQFEFFQEILDPSDFIARLVGLTGLIKSDCTVPYALEVHWGVTWPNYANPALLLILYWTLAFEARRSCHRKKLVGEEPKSRRKQHSVDSERQSLVTDDNNQSNYNALDSADASSTSKKEEEETAAGEVKEKPKRRSRSSQLSHFVNYLLKQSFVLALVAMMVWSITFHSWLAFVLLLWSCIIWMTPRSRKITYFCSPAIVLYGTLLFTGQYIYGFNLDELPETASGYKIGEIGFKKYKYPEYPCLWLGLQVLYMFMFWMTMRQFFKERREASEAPQSGILLEPINHDDSPTSPTGYKAFFSELIWTWLCKYWILMCCLIMLCLALHPIVTMYRLIYMALLLYFILTFQIWHWWWRNTIYSFWWVVIIYTMVVLITQYTYQFDIFVKWWGMTNFSDDVLHDIGLERYSTTQLFVSLLTPTICIIIIIVQVHFFHQPFLKLIDLNRFKKDQLPTATTAETVDSEHVALTSDDGAAAATSDTETTEPEPEADKTLRCKVKGCLAQFCHTLSECLAKFSVILWRILQIHIFKIVAFTIFIICCTEISAISAVYVILLCVFLPIWKLHLLFSVIAQFLSAVVLLAKMAYQLKIIKADMWMSNCTTDSGNETMTFVDKYPFNTTNNNAIWFGLIKVDDITYYIRNYLGIVLILTFEAIIRYHQVQYYNKPNVAKPQPGTVFADTRREDADKGLLCMAKFLINYFFYKFGLEICYVMFAITICVRVDAFAVIYAILLGILLCLSRRANAYVWPVYVIIIAILVPIQFMASLGFPYVLCIEYPWGSLDFVNRNLESWLFLPDYLYPPNPYKLLADFFLLLFICLQGRVFITEMSTTYMQEYGGGDNKNILPEVEAEEEIRVPDFTTTFASYLDVIKYFLFCYMFWGTVLVMFLAGVLRINLFSLGYLIATFCFMWYGQDCLLKPLRKLFCMWNALIFYCFFVMLAKAGLQLVGCVYIGRLFDDYCWAIQLLGITCLRPDASYAPTVTSVICRVDEDNTGLSWDVACFAFLLLQKRIFGSHYFRHAVTEFQAQNRLTSRGAQLINRILLRDIVRQRRQEKEVLEGIKQKMVEIKQKQASIRKGFVETEDHFQAIRSGDYYMFDNITHDEVPKSPGERPADSLTIGKTPDEEKDDKPGPLQLISTAMESDMKAAVDQAKDLDDPDTDESAGKGKLPPSRAEAAKDVDESSPEDKEDGAEEKGRTWLEFFSAIISSTLEWVISLFNRISRNYRFVARKLGEEMKVEKERIKSDKKRFILREGSLQRIEDSDAQDSDAPLSTDLVEIRVERASDAPDTEQRDSTISSLAEYDACAEDDAKFGENKSRVYRLFEATVYLIISRSDLICYFLMILDHLLNASLLSLPYPIMVFLWGMLSVPRPSKMYWITIITYTEALIVVKYLFQFGFFPWNDIAYNSNPFWPPRILGIEQRDGYANVDLALLLALFLHRTILKRFGLWKDEEDEFKELATFEGDKSATLQHNNVENTDSKQLSLEAGTPSTSADADVTAADDPDKITDDPNTNANNVKKRVGAIFRPFQLFYRQMTASDYNATTDVYAPMFLCDFINFIILLVGYSSFGPAQTSGTGDVSSYISENRIPVPFLIMLLSQFLLIIIDRALFLRKNVIGKFIFQIFLLILMHVWLFFILPAITYRNFRDNVPAQLFYFIKCVYFALSAYQIRSGYPTRILGNFLTKKYNYLNLFLFKGFLAIPFLLELRSLMDWIWTDTCLAIGSWLQMEDIYANIFCLKCWRHAEATYPVPRGNHRRPLMKYLVGGLLLIIIIFIIWFPLVLFSFANTVYIPNSPTEVSISVRIGGYEPLFKMSTQSAIKRYTEAEYKTLQEGFRQDRNALAFLSNYEPEDITKITVIGESTEVWGISPPSMLELQHLLTSFQDTVSMEFDITFKRENVTGNVAESIGNQFIHMLTNIQRTKLNEILADNKKNMSEKVIINGVFPRYMRLGDTGQADPVTVLMGDTHMSNISLQLQRGVLPGMSGDMQWWNLQEVRDKNIFDSSTKKAGNALVTDDTLTIITFNKRVAPASLSILTGYGIIGLYVSFILLIGRFLRMGFSGQAQGIMFKELPFVDHVLKLCLDLYLVREMKEFRIEEDMYAQLVFLYRSPETMIKITKMPQSMIKVKFD